MISYEESTRFPKGIVPDQPPIVTRGVPNAYNPTKEPIKFDVVGTVTSEDVDYDEGISKIKNFILKGTPLYALLMIDEEGTLNYAARDRQPCYGSIRTYGYKSDRPYDYFPSDLREPHRVFPAGNPLAVGFTLNLPDNWTANELWFNPLATPFREVFDNGYELIKQNNQIKGILFTDTHIDPSLMVAFIRSTGYMYRMEEYFKKNPPNKNLDFRTLFLQGLLQGKLESRHWMLFSGSAPDWARVWKGKVLPNLSTSSFFDRASYNRPIIDHVFGYDQSIRLSLPEKFKSWEHVQDYLSHMRIKEY